MTFLWRRSADVPRRAGDPEETWPSIDVRSVPLETAKTLLSEAGKYLESQQKGMDSLRGRLLDIARQCTTLAALVGGALGVTAVGSATVTASIPLQVAGWVAAACWVGAALVAAASMVPGDWGYAGRPVKEWWDATLIQDDEGLAQGTLLSMARSSESLIERNERREARMARRLKLALGLYVGAVPLAIAAALLAGRLVGAAAAPPVGHSFF